jgi:selenocysteine-specific elongation factor
VILAPPVLAERAAALSRRLEAHHREQPLAEGLPREEAREQLFPRAAPGVFDRVLEYLVRAGRIVARERLALTSHRLALSPQEAEAKAGLERIYRDAGLAPPALGEAAASLRLPAPVVEKVAGLLVRQRVLVRLDTLHFHAEALSGLKRDLAQRKAAAGGQAVPVDVPGFKDRYGVTRKFAIPLLEYLDRERVTRRVGDARVLL